MFAISCQCVIPFHENLDTDRFLVGARQCRALTNLCIHGSFSKGGLRITPRKLPPLLPEFTAPQWESKHFLGSSYKNALHQQAPKSSAGDNLAELANLPTVLLTLNKYLKLLGRD